MYRKIYAKLNFHNDFHGKVFPQKTTKTLLLENFLKNIFFESLLMEILFSGFSDILEQWEGNVGSKISLDFIMAIFGTFFYLSVLKCWKILKSLRKV